MTQSPRSAGPPVCNDGEEKLDVAGHDMPLVGGYYETLDTRR